MNQFDALIDRLAEDVTPVRAQSTRLGRATLAAIAAVTLAAVYLLLGFRDELMRGSIEPMLGVTIGLLAILAVAAGSSAVRMARPQVGAPGSGAPWALAALLVLPAIALAGIVAQPGLSAGLALGTGLRCLAVGILAALGSLAFLTTWLRRGAPVAPERASWLAGLASGAIGALAVTLECPEDGFAHLGVWHIVIPLAAGGATRLLLPRFLRW
ncbi:MAG: NrsF family protein [Sphingomicrobium sp.]